MAVEVDAHARGRSHVVRWSDVEAVACIHPSRSCRSCSSGSSEDGISSHAQQAGSLLFQMSNFVAKHFIRSKLPFAFDDEANEKNQKWRAGGIPAGMNGSCGFM